MNVDKLETNMKKKTEKRMKELEVYVDKKMVYTFIDLAITSVFNDNVWYNTRNFITKNYDIKVYALVSLIKSDLENVIRSINGIIGINNVDPKKLEIYLSPFYRYVMDSFRACNKGEISFNYFLRECEKF